MVAAYLLRRRREDQRLHGRVPDPEPGARARRRRRALVGVRARSSASCSRKGERKRAWRVASTLFWLMLLGLDGADGALHPGRAVADRPVRHTVDPEPRRRPRTDALPDRRPARRLRDHRRDPEQLRPLHRAGAVAGVLEHRDHRRARARRAARVRRPTTKLYVYAVSILIATVIQVFLPVPWLRGLDGRLQLVIDWRDPAVRRVFKLMIPVTLGLGLINVNAVIDTYFASRFIDPNLSPSAIQKAFLDLHAPAGDVLGRGRDRALPVALALRRARRHGGLPRTRSRSGSGRSRSCSSRGRRQRGARRADRPHPLPARQVPRRADAGRRRRARRVQRRARLQRRDADAEPRVLQPAVELDPDAWSRSGTSA